jgi:lambda family phage portal protein
MAKRATPQERAEKAEALARLRSAQVKEQQAKLRLQALKAAKGQLAIYQAADRGRRNKDWRAPNVSANMAILGDAGTLNARSRQMVRDSWVIKSVVRAFARNVIGTGILPIPQAKDENGNLLAKLNKTLMLDFWEWAGDKQWCDAEGDQTFWQMQALAECERVTVGESFWIWCYEPHLLPNGRLDLRKPVGLYLQAFEAEQLDGAKTRDAATGNVIRGGIELDARGRRVAYHVFTGHPNDYLTGYKPESKRIDASRVLVNYRKDRVGQKRGVTELAPVLQKARDLARYDDAMLWRAVMEACIGAVITEENPTGSGEGMGGILPREAGDSGTTPSGASTIDFAPGMVARLAPNEKVEFSDPKTPGNNYAPYTEANLRAIGAGTGLAYGQVSMDFTKGTYSGQRQELLEVRREVEPLQELLAHNKALPVYKLWLALSIAEGRYEIRDFEASPRRYLDSDYVAVPMAWIDPEKEANAIEKLIKMKLADREEFTQQRGRRFSDILDKLAAEQQEARDKGMSLEDGDSASESFRVKADAYGVAVRAGALTPNLADEDYFRKQAGLPALPADVRQSWKEQPTRQPITIAQDVATPAVPTKPAQAPPAKLAAAVPAEVPNYRPCADPARKCGSCRLNCPTQCGAYEFVNAADYVCEAWEPIPAALPTDGGTATQAPGVPDGQRPMDDPRSGFMDRGERGVQ